MKQATQQHQWSSSEVRLLSSTTCARCRGGGYASDARICHCVFRRIFEICYRRYQQADSSGAGVRVKGICCSRPAQEYAADFVLVGRRALRERPLLLDVFNAYIVDGLSTERCLPALGLKQNVFFRRVSEIKQVLGRYFRELKPYPLYPINEYQQTGPSFYERLDLDRTDWADDEDEVASDSQPHWSDLLVMPARPVVAQQHYEREAA